MAVRTAKLIFTLAVLFWVATLLWPEERATAPAVQPPTLLELNTSLALGEGYLDGLSHRFSETQGVTSEYYGLPLRLRFGNGDWLYPGKPGVTVDPAYKGTMIERQKVVFRQGTSSAEVWLLVYWDARHWDGLRLSLENRRQAPPTRCPGREPVAGGCPSGSSDPASGILVYASLDVRAPAGQKATVELGERTFSAAPQSRGIPLFRLRYLPADRSSFASWRYTFRHATAGMRELFAHRAKSPDARALGYSMESAGFVLGQDIYAPLWGRGTAFDDGMPYWSSTYRDCAVRQPSIQGFYPYRSKVCELPFWAYRWLSATDTLLPTLQSIHVMNRHRDPGAHFSDLDHRNLSPSESAHSLERSWIPIGMPPCSLFGCETRWASAVRTAAFGTLETILGYEYGDSGSRSWADAAARTLLRVQVGRDGWLRGLSGMRYRPLSAGAFYAVWDTSYRNNQSFSAVSGFLREELLEPLDMPAEFTGIVPSNAESTLAAVAFLARYRCQRYGVGCGVDGAFGQPVAQLTAGG